MTILDRRRLLRSSLMAAGVGATAAAGWGAGKVWAADEAFPDAVMNPVEVTGAEAAPIVGRLPGAQRMYMLPDGQGEHHRIGAMTMTRVARPIETAGSYELASFAGLNGAAMPRHAHLATHCALLVMGGEVELSLGDQSWILQRGDFANIPAGTPFGWTMRSDRGRLSLFMMSPRAGASYVAMGVPAKTAAVVGPVTAIDSEALARAALAGDFQLRAVSGAALTPVRVSNLILPSTPGAYVLLDGGGERFGGNTFYARNINTGGQFLFIITEGGNVGPGIGAHFHARHTEDFYAMDGETATWAYGKDVRIRSGDFIQAPPRHLHGFRMMQPYNRFVGFLTPGIFENFFTRGGAGRNGVGGRGAGEGSISAPVDPNLPSNSGVGRPPGGGDIFRFLSMGGRGPDGYPLDVHGATKPLPPQDSIWAAASRRTSALEQRLALLEHVDSLCGGGVVRGVRAPLSAQMQAVLALKPKARDFV